MSRVDDVLSIARLHKSQAEADVLRDMYFTESPGVIVEFCDAVIDLMGKQQAEIERLKQEKTDAVKRIERCRQNCISSEKSCDSACNKSGKEWYRAKSDAYKQALDIINEP